MSTDCHRCQAEPDWVVDRVGDAVVADACSAHLADVCSRLQRDHEVTQLTVRHAAKCREWAEIGRTLDKITKDPS